MQILAICGSLRAASTNQRLLAAAQALIPHGVEMHVTSLVSRLPLFNPDVPADESPIVREWASEMKAADGIVVSTPEYARGYPGALKNAFDWLVGTDAFVDKPFMLLNANARSAVGRQTLTTVLETMSGVHIESASVTIPLLGTNLDVADILANREFARAIQTSISTFVAAIRKRVRESPGCA